MHLDLGVKLRKHRSKFIGIAVAALYVFGPLQLARLIYLTVALLVLLERSGGKLRAPNSLTRLLGWWLIWMLPLQFIAAPVYLERFLTFVPLIAAIQQHHNHLKDQQAYFQMTALVKLIQQTKIPQNQIALLIAV